MLQFTRHTLELALVITDVDMPHAGGGALARMLSRLRPDLPLLVMSGHSGDGLNGEQVHAITRLAHGFLLKPFTPADLLSAVHPLVRAPARK